MITPCPFPSFGVCVVSRMSSNSSEKEIDCGDFDASRDTRISSRGCRDKHKYVFWHTYCDAAWHRDVFDDDVFVASPSA